MDEADEQPFCHEFGLCRDHAVKQGAKPLVRFSRLRVVSGNHILSKDAHSFDVVRRSEELECPDAYVTRSNPRQDRAWQLRLSKPPCPVKTAASVRVVGM